MREKIGKLCAMLKLDVAAFGDGADVTPVLAAALAALEAGAARERKLLGDLKAALALTDADTLDTLAGKLLPIVEKAKLDAAALSDSQARISILEKAEKSRAIAALKAEGKLTEAMLSWAEKQDLAALTDWAKTAPVVVPGGRTFVPGAVPAHDSAALSDSAASIARRCGLNPADVAKANGLKFAALVVGAVLASAALSLAAALGDNRDTPEIAGKNVALTQGSNVVYAGSMGALQSGKVVPASDTAGLVVVGRVEVKSDNTAANYSATKSVPVRRGVFRWANGGSFTASDIGSLAYVQDDQTVTTAAAATYDVVAGVIVGVDSSGVWVDTYAIGGSGAASVTTLSASGNASVGGTLAVTGASTLTGALAANGGINCDSGKFSVADTSGNVVAGGTLAVTGTTTVSNAVVNGTSVTFNHVPTATNGLSAGQLWSNSGVLTLMQ